MSEPKKYLTRRQLMERWGIGSTKMWKLERSANPPPRIDLDGTILHDPDEILEYERQHRTTQPATAA